MKKLVVLLMVFLMSSVSSFAAQDTAKPTSEILNAYLKIQEALASDSMTGVSAAATEISKKAKDPSMKNPAGKLSRATSLADARKEFKTLSAVMDKWAKKEKLEGIDRVTCSMAGASWLQRQGEIKNPYYGAQMQSCGEIQK